MSASQSDLIKLIALSRQIAELAAKIERGAVELKPAYPGACIYEAKKQGPTQEPNQLSCVAGICHMLNQTAVFEGIASAAFEEDFGERFAAGIAEVCAADAAHLPMWPAIMGLWQTWQAISACMFSPAAAQAAQLDQAQKLVERGEAQRDEDGSIYDTALLAKVAKRAP